MFYPRPYLFVMWGLIVVPVLAIVSIRLFRGALTLESKSAARLTFMIPLLLCDLALVVRSMSDFPILKWQPFWFPFLLITTKLFVLLLLQSADVRSRWASALLALGLCLAYGFGATLTLNSILDSSAGLVYSARVISRSVHSGEYGSASYYLRLSPWGPQRRAEEVEVSKSTYVSHPEGDAVQILVKQGRFQIPWFYVR